MSARGKSRYEQDCIRQPRYHDGTLRKSWAELGVVEQWSWERDDPADRSDQSDPRGASRHPARAASHFDSRR